MLSVIILTNKVMEDINARQQVLIDLLDKYNVKYEVTFVSTPQYNALQDIKTVVAKNEKHNLVLLNEETNKNSQIYVGLDNSKGDNVLILDIDTNAELIEQILQKYKDGCENVFVRPRKNAAHGFFTKLGMITYGIGLKMLKKLPDLCCENSVILLSKSSVEALLNNPQHQRELLNTNIMPDQKFALIQQKTTHDSPTVNQKRAQTPLFSLGILTTIFLIVTLAAMLIYPMFNGWIYSLWMFITIVIWLAVSVAFCAVLSKQIFNARQGEPIPLDIDGYPTILLNNTFTHSELYQQQEFAEYYSNTEQNEKKEKTKRKKQTSNKTKKQENKKSTTKSAKNKKDTEKQSVKKSSTKKEKEDKNKEEPKKKRGRPPKQK